MTGRTSRIRKHMLICFALENYDFFVEIMEKRRLFFCDFDIIDDSIGHATKYHTYKLFYFFSISVGSKVIEFFCSKFAKCKCLSCNI